MGPDLTTTDTVAVVCCALLGILLFLLGADVTRLRASRGPRDLMPTDPSDALLMAQRAHGNGAEYIPTLVILLLVCAALHGLRLRPGLLAQNGAVALKLLAIAAFLALAASSPTPPEVAAEPAWRRFSPGAFAVSLVWISFAYSGWNAAVYLASEIREPQRDLARSLWIGTALVTAAYLGLNAAFLGAAPAHALAGRADVGAVAASALGGETLRSALSALVAPAAWANRLVTLGLLPDAIRTQYGFSWDERQQRAMMRVLKAVALARSITPRALAWWPEARRPIPR